MVVRLTSLAGTLRRDHSMLCTTLIAASFGRLSTGTRTFNIGPNGV